MKPFKRPKLWLGLWALAIAVVIAVCLMPPPPLPPLPDNSDKVEHLLAYFVLAACAVQLFSGRRALAFAALGLVVLGIGIEIAQGPVSYTHLDVYKRQIQRRALQRGTRNLVPGAFFLIWQQSHASRVAMHVVTGKLVTALSTQ